MADTKISALPAVAAELDADEFACNQAGVTKKESRAQIVSTITAALGTHAGVTAAGVHGSSVAAGANTLVHRDAVGRAQVAGPAVPADIANKVYVDTVQTNLNAHVATTVAGTHGSSVAAGANTLAHRDAVGRTQFVDPAVPQDASTKNYCDSTKSPIGHVHGAGAEVQIVTGGITNDAVDNTKIRNSAATSVIGRAGAGVGDPADIVAGVNDRLLAQTAGTVAFQQLTVGMIPGGIITATEIANRTRKFYAPVTGGWNVTDGVGMHVQSELGIQTLDNKINRVWGFAIVPNDFASGMTVTTVVVPLANGNCYAQTDIRYGACGESSVTHTDTSGAMSAVAVTAVDNNCIHQVTLTNEAVGDILICRYERDATNVLDTVNSQVGIAGFIVEYTADS